VLADPGRDAIDIGTRLTRRANQRHDSNVARVLLQVRGIKLSRKNALFAGPDGIANTGQSSPVLPNIGKRMGST